VEDGVGGVPAGRICPRGGAFCAPVRLLEARERLVQAVSLTSVRKVAADREAAEGRPIVSPVVRETAELGQLTR